MSASLTTPLSLFIVYLSERFPPLICLIIPAHSHANSRWTQGHMHTKHNSLQLLYSWFVLVELSQLPFSSHFTCTYQRSSSGINGGIPSWIQTFCSWVFHCILLKNSHVPDAVCFSLFSPLSLINSVMYPVECFQFFLFTETLFKCGMR